MKIVHIFLMSSNLYVRATGGSPSRRNVSFFPARTRCWCPPGERKISDQLLRYSFLYRADCARDLGDCAEAIEYYDKAAGRFPEHHSSMTALIEIVNCYKSLGDENRARTAHRRALTRLKKLDDDAFREPDALMDREAWERWLQNMPVDDTRPEIGLGQ